MPVETVEDSEEVSFSRFVPRGNYAPGVASIGVELECQMSDEVYNRIMDWKEGGNCPRMVIEADGSLHVTGGAQATAEYTFWTTSRAEMKKWLQTMFGFGVSTNGSCGFHIHVKPLSKNLYVTATEQYWKDFHEKYRAFANGMPSMSKRQKYLSRLDAYYCREVAWDIREVIDAKNGCGGRYKSINLMSLRKHGIGTVEHRIMPGMGTMLEAMQAIDFLVGFVSEATRRNLKYFESEVPVPRVQSVSRPVRAIVPVSVQEVRRRDKVVLPEIVEVGKATKMVVTTLEVNTNV